MKKLFSAMFKLLSWIVFFYNLVGTQIPLVPIFASLHVVRRLLRRHAFSPLFGMSFVLSFADDDVRHCESKQMTETRTKA